MFGTLPAPCGGCLKSLDSNYRALYCGLGSSLARTYGYPFRALLSNDIAFLALLLTGHKYKQIDINWSRCCNPLASRLVAMESREVGFCSALSIFLFDHWLLDRRADSKSCLGFGYGVGRRMLEPKVAHACEKLQEFGLDTATLSGVLRSQPEIEVRVQERPGKILECAYPSELLCSEILTPFLGHLADALGRPLGRLIYFMDSLIDLESDARLGHFNPTDLCNFQDVCGIVSSTYHEFVEAIRKLEFQAEYKTLMHIVEQRIPAKLAALGVCGFETYMSQPTKEGKKKSRKNLLGECCLEGCQTEISNSCEENCCEGVGCCDCGDCCSGCDCSP